MLKAHEWPKSSRYSRLLLIGRTGDILMGGPWKTMDPGGGGGGAPLPLPAFESRCNAMHFAQDPQLLTDKGQKVDFL